MPLRSFTLLSLVCLLLASCTKESDDSSSDTADSGQDTTTLTVDAFLERLRSASCELFVLCAWSDSVESCYAEKWKTDEDLSWQTVDWADCDPSSNDSAAMASCADAFDAYLTAAQDKGKPYKCTDKAKDYGITPAGYMGLAECADLCLPFWD